MSNSEYSQLLAKMAELKTITEQYKTITAKYRPAVDATNSGGSSERTTNSGATIRIGTNDKYTFDNAGINAMSSTATPLVVRPGEDYKDFWKYVGKVVPAQGSDKYLNSQRCWNMAANDPRLFKAVVYNTPSTGYVSMVGRTSGGDTNDVYTKLGIVGGSLADASRLYDLQQRVNYLVEEIATLSDGGITTKLKGLVGSATDANTLIEKINEYMNTNVADISGNYYLTDKRKEMNNVYSEINEQRTLRARKYRFVFYIVLAISIIIGYASYTSKLPIIDQIDAVKQYFPLGWWANWWIITIVVIVFILSSFGWDMKGNILMVIRYVSDPEFWTGQLWWVGVTFLLLVIIFFYASFKSFFAEFDAGMKGIQEGLDGE